MTPQDTAKAGAGIEGLGIVPAVIGGLMSGKAKQEQLQYQAGVAHLNAQIAKQNEDYARAVGEVEAQQSGLKTKAEIASTRAIQGASGLDVNTGSASRVQQSEREIGWEDQSVIRANAAHRAYGYQVEEAQDTAQEKMYLQGAKTAKTAGLIEAATSLIGGASNVASKWSKAAMVGA